MSKFTYECFQLKPTPDDFYPNFENNMVKLHIRLCSVRLQSVDNKFIPGVELLITAFGKDDTSVGYRRNYYNLNEAQIAFESEVSWWSRVAFISGAMIMGRYKFYMNNNCNGFSYPLRDPTPLDTKHSPGGL